MEGKVRRRINVGVSTKGVITWDCTIEAIDDENNIYSNDGVLLESDDLVSKLKKRYPTEV